jgi:hypothetical protein
MKWTFAACFAVLLSFYLYSCLKVGNDFWTFHDIGIFALQRADIYAASPTTGMYVFYLPHFSLLMMPFGILPVDFAAIIWFALKIASLYLFFKFVRSRLDPEQKKSFWIALVPMLLLVNPLNSDFRLGQVNLFVHLALVASYFALTQSRRVLAAFLFVIACIKVTPLIFLGFFVLKREFRFLGWCVAWFLGFLGLLGFWFGVGATEQILLNWWSVSSREKLGLEALAYFENQAFLGLFARLAQSFPDLPLFSGAVHVGPVILPAFKAWAYGLSAVCLGAACAPWVFMRRFLRSDALSWELLYALFFVLMLLASPDTRNAHLIHLLFPVMILWQLFYLKTAFARLSRLALGVSCLGLILTSRDILGVELNRAFREHSHQTIILLFVFASFLWFMWKQVRVSGSPQNNL